MNRRRIVTATLVAAFEGYLYYRYAQLGAQFHFWLHGLFGLTLGLSALTAWRLVRRKLDGRVAPWEAGALGHVYSAVPDVLFLVFGVLHMVWMDVFALHISLHFVPYPLQTQLVLVGLALAAYGLARDGRRRPAAGALVGALVVVGVAMLVRYPIPGSVGEMRENGPGLAWMCPLTGVDVSSTTPRTH